MRCYWTIIYLISKQSKHPVQDYHFMIFRLHRNWLLGPWPGWIKLQSVNHIKIQVIQRNINCDCFKKKKKHLKEQKCVQYQCNFDTRRTFLCWNLFFRRKTWQHETWTKSVLVDLRFFSHPITLQTDQSLSTIWHQLYCAWN